MDMSNDARTEALAPMQTLAQGAWAREVAETGQPRMKSRRTFNVQNEDKEFKKELKTKWKNARTPDWASSDASQSHTNANGGE